ncbi:cytochrome c maturation protein CcmE [Roseicyclus sp. F158]|uniref:Cytochrome c-type biogenesis protein CcmE n=1 Tax=Tropicimonas omnivorans TaxID=3075590 RepID=A0ABU3DJ21_9RHOB|nr:cytochrome c maturation protein CcmE [Roseicyclus sp. F158]MDT0683720.1 cytochrome c maturation protein CcmE [Roseicyclus sp. F158]
MRSLKKKRRIQIILVAVLALVSATVLIGVAMKDGINFFRPPSEVLAAEPGPDETFRIGGLVEEGTLVSLPDGSIMFNVTDGAGSVPVTFTGVPPDLFAEGQGMIGTGRLVAGTFEASEILARHDETYMPAEVVDALKDQGVYREPES